MGCATTLRAGGDLFSFSDGEAEAQGWEDTWLRSQSYKNQDPKPHLVTLGPGLPVLRQVPRSLPGLPLPEAGWTH